MCRGEIDFFYLTHFHMVKLAPSDKLTNRKTPKFNALCVGKKFSLILVKTSGQVERLLCIKCMYRQHPSPKKVSESFQFFSVALVTFT